MTPSTPDLRTLPFFAGLPDETRRFLQERLELRPLSTGQVLIQPGQFGDFLALVQSGQIILELPNGTIQRVGPGGAFGEGMLRYGVPSSFTARAIRPTRLWVLPRAEWLAAEFSRLNPDQPVQPALSQPKAEPKAEPKALLIPSRVPGSGLPGAVPSEHAVQGDAPSIIARVPPPSPWKGLYGAFAVAIGVLFLALVMLGPTLLPILNQSLVDLAVQSEQPGLAVAYLKFAAVWQPDTAGLYNDLGDVLYQQAKLDPAIAAFEKSLAADDQFATAQNNLAVALLAAGHPADALPHLQQAVELDPGSPIPFFNLGNTYLALGELGQAEKAYQHAYELDPWQLDARARSAGIAAALGRTDEARHIWNDLLTIQPDQPLANQGLGMLAVWHGRPVDALPYLEAARAADPGDPLTHLYLGMVLEALDRPEEAAAEYSQALALSQSITTASPTAGQNPPDVSAGLDAPHTGLPTYNISPASLAHQAQQRLLSLLPRLAPPASLQTGGSPGANP